MASHTNDSKTPTDDSPESPAGSAHDDAVVLRQPGGQQPVFGDHKENRGWRRFRRRGLTAASSEWALMNLSHNIAKLVEHRTSPTALPT